MKRFHHLPIWIRTLVITAGAFALSWFVAYDLTSISFFAPMEKVSDYRFSDFYMAVADEGVHHVDNNVVVVALDGCDRQEIARAIRAVDMCAPRAIGLDIMFGTPREGLDDSALIEALSDTPGLVLPVYADEETALVIHGSYYDSLLMATGSPRFAAINIEGEKYSREAVRELRTSFGPVPSMASALAGNTAADEVLPVDYAGREYHILYPDEILENYELVEGKIVIMGKIDDIADLHATPLTNFMPGTLIHAYNVSTLLNDNSRRHVPDWVKWIIAFGSCYIIVWLNIMLAHKGYGNLAVRIVQILMLYLMIVAGTWIYVDCNVDIDFGFPVLMVSLGLLAYDIVCGIMELRIPRWKINKLFTKFLRKGSEV